MGTRFMSRRTPRLQAADIHLVDPAFTEIHARAAVSPTSVRTGLKTIHRRERVAS